MLECNHSRFGIPESEKAKLAAERAVYDALLYDPEFRQTVRTLYRYGDSEALSLTLKSVISNETAKDVSDAKTLLRTKHALEATEKLNRSVLLTSALSMLDSNEVDYVTIYRNAEGMLQVLTGLFRNLSSDGKANRNPEV